MLSFSLSPLGRFRQEEALAAGEILAGTGGANKRYPTYSIPQVIAEAAVGWLEISIRQLA